MNISALRDIGLTNTEINIYMTTLELGPSLASRISQKSKVERAVTYHILEKLIRKGIISFVIKENRKYFNASEPEKLRDLLREKEDSLNELIPELIKLKRADEQPLSIEVFRGKEGFKTVLEDLIRDNKPYFIIGYTGKAPMIAGYWYRHWNKRRVQNKVVRYLLIHKARRKIDALEYPLTKIRVLPTRAIHESKSSIIIYGVDKVLLFLPIDEFAGIRIKNSEIHDAYKDYFDILWKQSKSI